MPRIAAYDRRALQARLGKQQGIVTRAQAIECGMSFSALRYRVRDDGPWRQVLPGVYATHAGPLTPDQRDIAALLYAGPASVITGAAALRRYQFGSPGRAQVDVLVPARRTRADVGFARLHRTTRLPEVVGVAGPVSFAPPPRAVADSVRGLADLREVRAIVAGAVQRGIVPITLLARELDAGPVRGSARLRQALAEVADGVRSVAEADLHALIRRCRLPQPMFNPRLFAGDEFLAVPDCWWPDTGVAAEVDSREWHLSPHDWEATMTRHTRMSAHGIIVLHFSPHQVRREPRTVAAAIAGALAANRGRSLPGVRALPAR